MERRVGLLALSLIPVFCLGLVNLSFSDDTIRLETRDRSPAPSSGPRPKPHDRYLRRVEIGPDTANMAPGF